jgi:hypothetical protein
MKTFTALIVKKFIKKDLMDAKINELAKTLIDSHLNDLFEYTEANIKIASKAGKLNSKYKIKI